MESLLKYVIVGIIVILIFICIGLHFLILHELRDISDSFSDTYNNFCDELELLADILTVYHDLLKEYQIPMIANPTSDIYQVVNGRKEEHW